MEDEEQVAEVDFYALLNVSKEATLEEIRASYKRLCVQYHPDKHLDSENKDFANEMFGKIQKAYNVLSDPRKRAIYDLYGIKGLNAGLTVATVDASANEIREEYDRICREREEELRRRQTNAEGKVTMNIDATSLFNASVPISEKMEEFELSGMNIMQSVQAPLTNSCVCTFRGDLLTSNGNGMGKVEAITHYDISARNWVEVEVGSGNESHVSTKFFQNIDPSTFVTVEAIAQQDMRRKGELGGILTIGRQIIPKMMGYLTWKLGIDSCMETSFSSHNEVSVSSGTLQIRSTQVALAGVYEHKFGKLTRARMMSRLSTGGVMCEYGGEHRLTKFNSFGMWLSIGVPNGVVLKMKFTRAEQAFATSIQIADMPSLASVLFGTFGPASLAYLSYTYIIDPIMKSNNKSNLERIRQQTFQATQENKREAELAVKLMTESVKLKLKQEEDKQGFIIIRALYGNLESGQVVGKDNVDSSIIDVTIPLQNLVVDSQLHLQSGSKMGLVGFFDCCVGESKQLKIQYSFKSRLHEALIKDEESLSCPKRSHLISLGA